MNDDPLAAARQILQRLVGLRRAGVDRIPRPVVYEPTAMPLFEETEEAEPPFRIDSKPVAPFPQAPDLLGHAESREPVIPASERAAALAALATEVAACTLCPLLAPTRTQTVFGEGSPTARLMFVGEAPGETEDRTGRPFVGKAGMLLTDMITKGMGLRREDVYIANILKSRPPNNRDPQPDEVRNCLPYLERQFGIIRPEFLCILGKPAAHALLETAMPLGRLRGKWHSYRGIPTVVTWHPAYLLRNPAAKKDTWDDLQMLMKRMGIKPPERKT